MSKFNQLEDFPEDDYYLSRMKEILEEYPRLGPLRHPSKLVEHVYIGNQENADDIDLLQALEITHVLNVAGTRTFDLTRSPYKKDTGIVGFLMMPAEDYEEYDIMQYFMDAIIFLDKVKAAGGRALVHCNIGVNRSGAIVAAYLMIHQRRTLLKVIDDLKSKRSLILQNEGFRRQLVRFARCRGLLDVADPPPKKHSTGANGCATNGYKESKTASNQEKSGDVVKSLSDETPNAAEEVTKDPQEAETRGTSGTNSFSKDPTGDYTQNSSSLDERRTPVTSFTGTGKYAGYENELGNLDEKRERSYGKLSYLDAPGLANLEDKIDRSHKISYLDLGNSAALFPSSDSYYADYPISSRSSRKADVDPLLSTKLLALSLEVPLARIPSSSAYDLSRDFSYKSPQLDSVRDYYPRLRASTLVDKVSPATSLSQHISRESSISDASNSIYASLDDVDLSNKGRTSIAPVSSCYYEYDSLPKDYPTPYVPLIPTRSISAANKFVSIVKPRSYYQKLVSPIALESFEADDNQFGFERSLSSSRRPYSSGKGMLFTPYLASSRSSSSLGTNSFTSDVLYQPRPYVDMSYIVSQNPYARNDPYNRNSLSDLDNLRSYDFPQYTSTGRYSSYRPTSNHRSTFEYDDAVDEYSDLLDASHGKSDAISAVAKSRVRMGTGSGFRKAYKY